MVCDLGASVVTAGIAVERTQAPRRPPAAAAELDPLEPAAMLETLLASPNGASRAPIYRGYDTEVRGRAVVRPGEGDAGVLAPVPEAPFGLAMSVGGIPAYGLVDPYLAGLHAAYEAMRNVVAVGAEPIALTDCLNFGNPEDPEVFSAFVAAVDGIADAARGIGRFDDAAEPIPVVSGNVSFYNESTTGRAIAPSPIVACAGRLASLADATTLRLKEAGSALIAVGERRLELGGSELVAAASDRAAGSDATSGGPLPPIDLGRERLHLYGVLELIRAGLVRSCHDIASGGLLITAVEMALGESSLPSLGLDLDLDRLAGEVGARSGWSGTATAAVLFGEAPGFVLEVASRDLESAASRLQARGVAWWSIGRVAAEPRLLVRGIDQPIDADLESLGARRATGLVNALA
jgi:phosphoribosylformylglycinamidine synthase